MPLQTDPAREFVDLCRSLPITSSALGDEVLASSFNVEVWSPEFFEINFFILARIRELQGLIATLPLDDDTKEDNASLLNVIANAFGPKGHRNAWSHSRQHYLNPATIGPLANLSGLIRPRISYPKLDDEERIELLGLVDQLLEWLRQHQLTEQDFIRQALIDGLTRFRFRLDRIQWIGWGYTIDSLRYVIGAYFSLERGFPNDGANTTAQAMLKMIFKFIKTLYEKTKFAKDIFETGDFMLRAYGAASLGIQAAPYISGYLP